MIRFTVPGEPKAKQRPRRGKGYTYTPKETINYETWVKECFVIAKQKKLEGCLKAHIIACFKIPKSTSKIKKVRMLNGEIRPNKKPDTDNIAKIILDALNNMAFDDDKQVVDLQVVKIYSEEPEVEIIIRELEG